MIKSDKVSLPNVILPEWMLLFVFLWASELPAQQATSLLGKPLHPPKPSGELLASLASHREQYEQDPTADHLIWYGRFLAYSGDYRRAIETYSKGIEEFPADARMYRHRGHRYITLREFDLAINDFDRAIELTKGKANQIEPDGMPNAQNIPVTTLQGNIYYHKALAHYLKGEWEPAVKAWKTCQRLGDNHDNLVSSGHWIYSTLRRMGRTQEAMESLSGIHGNLKVIENHSYHKACLFYAGEITEAELMTELDTTPSGDSIRYAHANWLFCEGRTQEAKQELQSIVQADGWASFGHIAAEADLSRWNQ